MKRCVLCKSMATIYCESDRASLCWTCDTKVHSANFLVARHSRSLLCQICQSPTLWCSSGEELCSSTSAICRTCDVKGVSDEGDTEKSEIGNADGDEIDNQVVALSSTLLPPAVSSSSSEEVFARDGGSSLKRKHQKVAIADYKPHEDEIDSSSVNINHYEPSSKVGTVRDRKKLGDRNIIFEEKMHAPLLRGGKLRRTVEFDLNLPAIE